MVHLKGCMGNNTDTVQSIGHFLMGMKHSCLEMLKCTSLLDALYLYIVHQSDMTRECSSPSQSLFKAL